MNDGKDTNKQMPPPQPKPQPRTISQLNPNQMITPTIPITIAVFGIRVQPPASMHNLSVMMMIHRM